MRSPPLVFWADKKSRAALHIANGKARSTEKIEPAKTQPERIPHHQRRGRKSSNNMTLPDLSDLFIDDLDEFDNGIA